LLAMSTDLDKYCSPNEDNNVTLIIGDKKLRVLKDYLALHSPIFDKIFFDSFVDKKEIEIKKVVYEQFVDLVELIFSVQAQITDSTVSHIMDLADRFMMKQVIAQCEIHLISSTTFALAGKLKLSEQYRLVKLKDHSLNSFYFEHEIITLEAAPEYSYFSANLKTAICDLKRKLIIKVKVLDEGMQEVNFR
ncbi:hypothetical protein PMAYCL1PPCAC_25564, partial [Pristionchus mayeri]